MSSIFRGLRHHPLPVLNRETSKDPSSSIALIISLSLIVCLAIMAGLLYHYFSDLLFC